MRIFSRFSDPKLFEARLACLARQSQQHGLGLRDESLGPRVEGWVSQYSEFATNLKTVFFNGENRALTSNARV